jgi:two-component system response regulator NreC
MEKISIILAIRHTLIRHSLRALLEHSEAFTVLLETEERDSVAPIIANIRPDILLIETTMLAFDGITLVRRLAKRYPSTHIVVMSLFGKESMGLDWLRAGAAAFVSCSEDGPNLIYALQSVMAEENRSFSSPRSLLINGDRASLLARNPLRDLTAREQEVLSLAAEGYTSLEIADKLSISSRTVEGHRSRGMRRAGLRTTADLVRYALQHGWIPSCPH